MQITTEENGNLTTTICIELEKSDYSEKVEQKLKEYRRKVKLPGFREGKVPLGMVNKMYGKALLAEEINSLISESLENYLIDNNIRTLASPLPNSEKQQQIDFDTQNTFSFYFDIALRPEIDPDLESLDSVKLYEIEPEESKTEEYIAHILKRYGNLEDTETIEKDSLVRCEIRELNAEGETFEGGISVESTISIEKIKDEGLRSQFTGAEMGKVIRMNPMEAFGNLTEIASMLSVDKEKLPDPPGDFHFRILSAKSLVPAVIDEKLLGEVFPDDNLKTEEELRERVRRDIRESFNKEAGDKLFYDSIDELLKQLDIQLPDSFMKRWLTESGDESRITPEDLEEGYEGYARQLKIALLKSSLIEKYRLRVEDSDYHSYIMKALNIHGGDENDDLKISETVKSITENIRKDKEQSEKISERIMEQKLTDLIREKVPYTREQITADGFYELLK